MSDPTPKEIREAYSDYRSEWQDIRDEAGADMQAISTMGPWTAEDRAQREDSGRPCIHLDQINQYLHQYTGSLRKTKRAIQVTPKGEGATDQDAEKRSSVIRAIEEKSNAPSAVYIPAAESAAHRSYGFAVIRTQYKDEESFDQEIVIKPVPNPDCVLLSPYYKQPNASDIDSAFLIEPITKKRFQQLYPDAEITNFEDADQPGVSDWIRENFVMRAEFWKIEKEQSKLFLVDTAQGPIIFTEKEWKEAEKTGAKGKIRRERTIEIPSTFQYMTNGIELLDKIRWPGSRIPIISCLGPERWVTEGGRAKRELLSLVRFARDPQMYFDYLATSEAEIAKKVPKVPFIGAKGQFESDQEAWEECTDVPHAFLQYDPITDATGQTPLPPPSFTQFQVDFAGWEVAKDAVGRSIQSAMGISPLPTAAQRNNEKSGVALQKIQQEQDNGSYQFVDNFENGFLHNMGWQINELITPVLDTAQELPVAKPDGSRGTLQLVGKTSHPMDGSGAYEVQGLDENHLHTAKGEFDVTISSGPSEPSQREAQGDFVDSLLENMPNLPPPGTPAAKILALGIRMRPDLGPIGKQIADVFDPPDPNNLPPEAQAIIQPLQAQVQQLSQENAALHMERAGKVLELQSKQNIETLKHQGVLDKATMDFITKVVVAELNKGSKTDPAQAQSDAQQELRILGMKQSHDAALQTMDHIHEHNMADKNAQNAQLSQASDQVHQQTMAEQSQQEPGAEQ